MSETLQTIPRSARKAKGDGHLRRAEILGAAERIFVAEGYEGATIRKIADEVGVSSTCLYMHFRDKEAILLEICTSAMADLLETNRAIAALPIEAVERVRAMLHSYIDFAIGHPNTYRLVFGPSTLAATVRRQKTARDLGEQCSETFNRVVREVAASGRLRTGDPDTVHKALWAACHGLAALVTAKPNPAWDHPQEVGRVMIEGLLFGLIAD